MPDYRGLDGLPDSDRTRAAEGLQRLRSGLASDVPAKTLDSTMLLATWNIRELDSSKYGYRDTEAYLYIAEVLSRFDLVAIQEVREDLAALRRLLDLLGPAYRYIVTDVTEGRAGNGERMAFLYDSRTVTFGGLAGELVLPPLSDGTAVVQVARTPFLAGFTAGWTSFQLATVHILYGSSKAADPRRTSEIREVAAFLGKRAGNPRAWSPNLVLLGDFNIFRPEDVTMQALTEQGWVVPEPLQQVPASNVAGGKHYDQIAFREKVESRFRPTGRSGVFDPLDYVYRDDDEQVYADAMGEAYRRTKTGRERTAAERRRHYRAWRTYRMSDHLPMWLEVQTDFASEYLEHRRKW